MASTDPAQPDASSAALIPLGSHAKNAAIELKRPITLIGSRKDIVRLHLDSSTVSKAHAVVVLNAWGCYVADLGSRTGTLVNGKPVVDVDLSDGDVLQIGRFQFKYRAPRHTKSKRRPLDPADFVSPAWDAPVPLNKRVAVLGRRAGADVQFDSGQVSNVHALVVEQDGRRVVRDLSSRTGTWLDGRPIHQEILPPGTPINIGGTTLTLAPRPADLDAPDEPLTLADAGPALAAAGLAAAIDAPAETVALDALDLDLPPVSDAPHAGDDLAALRRNWKTPGRTDADADEIALDVPVESPNTDALPLAEAEPDDVADLDALRPDPDAPAVEPAETPDISGRQTVSDTAEPVSDTTTIDPIDLSPEAEAEIAEIDVAHAPTDAVEAPAAPAEVAAPTAETPAIEADERDPDDIELDDAEDAEVDDEAAVAEAPAEPLTVEAPAPSTPAAEAPLELDLDDIEPDDDLAPVAEATPADAEAEDKAVAETPAAADEFDLAPLDLDVLAGPAAPAEALVDDAPDVTPEPVVVEPLPVAERPNLDALAEPPDFTPPAETAEAVATERELDASDLDALELADLEPGPVAEASGESAIAESVFVDDAGRETAAAETLDLDVLAGPAAEPESPVDDAPDVRPEPVVVEPLPAAERPALDVLAEPPAEPPTVDAAEDVEQDLDLLEREPAEAAIESPAVVGEAAVVVPTDDEDEEIEPLDLQPLDLGDLVVAPAVGSEPEAADAPPIGLETPEPAESVVATAAAAPADDLNLAELEPLDLDDLELDLDAPKPGTAVDADLDALILDTDAPALELDETPGIAERQTVSDTAATVSDTPVVDQIDLAADEAADDAEAAARDPMSAAVFETAVTEATAPDEASAATIIDRVAFPPPTPGEAPSAETLAAPADAETPPVEADHIRLAEDVDDEANEATALAVDLGLILDDEPHDTLHAAEIVPAPGPDAPVDIDLSGPSLSGLDGFAPLAPAATSGGTDFIDADHVEQTPSTDAPPAAAAEAPKPDDDQHIAPPQGGSLSDLIPSGGPILGGSFMSLPQPLPSLPSIPRSPTGPGGKRRPMRVGFGGEQPKPAAPFAADRTISDAAGASAFVDDDAAPSPLGRASIDAFGGGGPAAVPAPAPQADAETPAFPPERFRPRGTIRPVVPGQPAVPVEPLPQTTAAVTPAAVYSAENELLRARRHKLRVRRVIVCLVAMIVLISGAFAGVYYFMPLKSSVDALITFSGLDGLGVEDRTNFQIRQNQALLSETVRSAAVTNLPPAVADAGFLASGKTIYDTVTDDPKVRWPAGQSVMRLQVRTTDRTADLYRVRALADALVKANQPDAKRRAELLSEAADFKSRIDAYRRQMTDLSDQIQALEQAAVNRPAVRNTSDLNAEYLAAEPALTSIKSQRQELEATVERLSKPAAKTAGNANADTAAADEELTKLTAQLAELQQATTRPASNDADARKKLDESIALLEQNLADAQKLRDNPQLTAYVESASRLFKQMRDFTESLMRRQETMRTQLGELKARMSDNLQAVTQDKLAKDAELKKLRDSLAITERQFNAANASGFGDEAKKLELQLRLLKVKVAERQDQFQNDSIYSPAIASLQKLIDGQEAQIKADRKDIDDRLTALQGDFLKNAPAVEKLPAEQKQLAEGIEAKMKAMNDARRDYARASEAAAAAQAKAEADSREKVAALRVQIAARRQDVLAAAAARQAQDDEQTRLKNLAVAQTQLADVRLAEQKAAHRVTDASTAIEKNEQQRRINATADADLSSKRRERDDLDRKLREVQTEARTREAQIARLIVPESKVDTMQDDDKDRRPLLAGGIAGGVAILLLIPILLDLLALSREAHGHAEHEPIADDRADGFEPVLPAGTGDRADQKTLPQPASVG